MDITEKDIDKMIDDAQTAIISDNPKEGAEALLALAQLWSKAGLPQASFMDLRTYIINEAIEKTSKAFVKERLIIEERELRNERTGSIILQ